LHPDPSRGRVRKLRQSQKIDALVATVVAAHRAGQAQRVPEPFVFST
jgi:hypothetical protein